jgi:uncharacterized protein (TIGR01777 family)
MHKVKNVLITGGSGLIGTRLTELLIARGYAVSHLGRSRRKSAVDTFCWDIEKGTVEAGALDNADAIVHLAGAGVNDKRWTIKRKKEILESRTRSTRLLFEALGKKDHKVGTFISASGIGYYGFGDAQKVFIESDPPGSDFLAGVTTAWENAVDALRDRALRLVKIRIGVVLTNRGGALTELARPVKLLAGAPLGSGEQCMSWIHLDDLCGIFIKAIEDSRMNGVYNAVAPNPVTNRVMTQGIAHALHKPLVLPPIPGFLIKIAVGEIAEVVLNGSVVSSGKIQEAGFTFQFETLEKALENLLSH